MQIVDKIVWCVLHHGDLLQDYLPFFYDIFLIKKTVKGNIGQNVHSLGETFAKNPGIKGSIFLTGESVKGSSE